MTVPPTPRAGRQDGRSGRHDPFSTLLVWCAGSLLLLGCLTQLAIRPIFDPDEGRNAGVMREMAASNDYLVPHLNGLAFLDKPFLYYAAGGLSIAILGANVVAVRLPSLLSTLATLLLVGWFARRRFGRPTGMWTAVVVGATPLSLIYSQIVIFDAMLTMWLTAATLALYHAVEIEPAETRVSWSHLAWTAMALGVLTKGPVALLVPLAAVIPWALWRRRLRRVWSGGAPLVLVLTIGPWLWAVMREDPLFLHYALVTETLGRLSGDALNRGAPVWYYLPYLLLGALPWSLVPLTGWRQLREAWREREPTVLFLLSWSVTPFLLLSLVESKRPHYILPILPALALLSVWIWSRRRPGEALPGARAGAGVWLALGVLLIAEGFGAAPGVLRGLERFDHETVALALVAIGFVWVAAGVLAWLGRRSPAHVLLAFALPPVAFLVLSAPVLVEVGEERSTEAMIRAVQRAGLAGEEFVAIETLPPSFVFYLGRPVTLISADGDPMRSNYLLRRYAEMVDVEPTLRSPAWLRAAVEDRGSRRLFLVDQRHLATRELLEASGREVVVENGRYRLYRSPGDRRADPPGSTLPAPRRMTAGAD